MIMPKCNGIDLAAIIARNYQQHFFFNFGKEPRRHIAANLRQHFSKRWREYLNCITDSCRQYSVFNVEATKIIP